MDKIFKLTEKEAMANSEGVTMELNEKTDQERARNILLEMQRARLGEDGGVVEAINTAIHCMEEVERLESELETCRDANTQKKKEIMELRCREEVADSCNKFTQTQNEGLVKEIAELKKHPLIKAIVCPYAPDTKILTECPMKSEVDRYKRVLIGIKDIADKSFQMSVCQDGIEIGCLPTITFCKDHTTCLNNLPQGKSFVE